MPCYFSNLRIKNLLKQFRQIQQRKIEEELLKEKTNAELHDMSEEELFALIVKAVYKLFKKKMR